MSYLRATEELHSDPTFTTVTIRGNTASGALNVEDTTETTSATTGSVTLAGGLGVAKSIYVGNDITVTDDLTVGDALNVTGLTSFSDVVTFNDTATGTTSQVVLNNSNNALGDGNEITFTNNANEMGLIRVIARQNPAYNAGTTYYHGDRVSSGGVNYVSIYLDGTTNSGHSGNTPPNATYWEVQNPEVNATLQFRVTSSGYFDVSDGGILDDHAATSDDGIWMEINGSSGLPKNTYAAYSQTTLSAINSYLGTVNSIDMHYPLHIKNGSNVIQRPGAQGAFIVDGGATIAKNVHIQQKLYVDSFIDITGDIRRGGTKVVGAQQSAVAGLTDSSGGTDAGAGGTIAAIGASYVQAEVRNAVATLAGQIERIAAALRAHGLIAS